jgi:hypothetical protein
VVPYARGHERSRNSADVLAEVKGLVEQGYKDITLLGQNVNSYNGGCDFATLLTQCASFDGEYRMRFMTSHPKDASSALIDAIAQNEKIAKHKEWVDGIVKNNPITPENCAQVIRDEIGKVFADILKQCGVFDRTDEGKKQFLKFIDNVNN